MNRRSFLKIAGFAATMGSRAMARGSLLLDRDASKQDAIWRKLYEQGRIAIRQTPGIDIRPDWIYICSGRVA